MINIIIADDDDMTRYGSRTLLERQDDITVIAEASCHSELQELILEHHDTVDLLILDIYFQTGAHGHEIAKHIHGAWPDIAILMFSQQLKALEAERAFRAGAQGYLTKSRATDHLVDAVRSVASGNPYVSEDIQQQLASHSYHKILDQKNQIADLSDRELTVVRLLGEGHGVQDIAKRLDLATGTIHCYRTRAREKLGFKQASQLDTFARNWMTKGSPNAEL